jgi:hypothetical protein
MVERSGDDDRRRPLLALAVALIAQAAGPIIAAQAISTRSRVAVPPRRGLGGGA